MATIDPDRGTCARFPAMPEQAPTPCPPPPDDLAQACATPRLQPYRFTHKALRALLAHTLIGVGALDAQEPAQRRQLVDDVDRALSACEDHIARENAFLHEPLQARSARAVRPYQNDHWEHLATIDALRLLLQRVRDTADDAHACALAYELYLRLSQLVGDILAHMAEEESTMTRLLWTHFSDEQLAGFLQASQTTLSPDEQAQALRWMARSLNVPELARFLKPLGAPVPRRLMAWRLELVRGELSPQAWSRLAALIS